MRRKNDSFIDYLECYFNSYLPIAKGLSKSTISSYKTTFRLLMEYLYVVDDMTSDRITFDTLDDKRITDFLNWLETERKCGIATRNQRLSAIVAFSIYVQNRDLTAATFRNNVLKVPKKKAPRQGRSCFTRDEIKILLSLPVLGTEIGLRDRTILCFMYASGTRAQEVCDLTVGDIQFYPDRAGINIHGKGQKMRRIGIPTEASNILCKYIKHRGILDEADRHVFSSQTHEKMSVSCIEEIYAKYIEKAKLKYPDMFRGKYTPHSMRHTTATHMLDAGVPLIVVKNFLGHVSLQTTQIYIEITQDTMNRHLKSWNDKWFLKDDGNGRQDSDNKIIPDFLR